jgi:hypothetical protein
VDLVEEDDPLIDGLLELGLGEAPAMGQGLASDVSGELLNVLDILE